MNLIIKLHFTHYLMNSDEDSFLSSQLNSIKYASKGLLLLIKTERNIQIQTVIAIAMTVFGFIMNISPLEWTMQLFAIGLVMATEGINTAIEKLCDYIQPNHDAKIAFIKDVSAGAVLIAALVAICIGLFIYLPRLF